MGSTMFDYCTVTQCCIVTWCCLVSLLGCPVKEQLSDLITLHACLDSLIILKLLGEESDDAGLDGFDVVGFFHKVYQSQRLHSMPASMNFFSRL